MRILKFKHFESINVIVDPEMKNFNKTLISPEFIEGVKDHLYDLSDETTVQIGLKNSKVITKAGALFQKDLLVINVNVEETYEEESKYINRNLLEDSVLSLQSWASDYDINVLICESYLPFEKVDEFFTLKTIKSELQSNFLRDVSIILF